MNVFALCTLRSQSAVQRALGVEPVTAPPYAPGDGVLWLQQAVDADLWYIRLHGRQNVHDEWYGEAPELWWVPALHVDDFEGVDLRGKVVIAATCFGLHSAFVPAVLAAGGRFIGGADFNYAGVDHAVVGADKLAALVRKGMERGLEPAGALIYAKLGLLPTLWRKPDRDAFKFQLV